MTPALSMTAQLMLLDLSYTNLQAAGGRQCWHTCAPFISRAMVSQQRGRRPGCSETNVPESKRDVQLRQCYEQTRQRSSLAPAMLAASLRDTPVLVSRPERYPLQWGRYPPGRQLMARTPRCATDASASAHVVSDWISVRWIRLRNSSAEWYSLPTVLTTGEAKCGPAGGICHCSYPSNSDTAPGDCSRPSSSRLFKYPGGGFKFTPLHAPGDYSRP